MTKKNEEVDELTLTTRIIGKIEMYMLTEIFNTVETCAHAQTYIKTVKECYRTRMLDRLITEVRESIDDGVESDDIMASIMKRVESIDKTEQGMIGASEWIQGGIDYLTSKDESNGITTGFKKLDKTIRGLNKQKLIILAARPALGKSSLAMNIVESATAVMDEPACIFSLEMPNEELASRAIVSKSEKAEDKIRLYLNRSEVAVPVKKACEELSARKIFVDDTADITVSQIQARARKIKHKHGLGLIVIDYLQLITPEHSNRNETRERQVANMARSMKKMSRNLDVPVICLAQLSREVEKQGRKPRLSDLRESGAIEQDADIVMFLHQDEAMAEEEMVLGIVAKQRNGPIGEIELKFTKYWTKFTEWKSEPAVDEDFFEVPEKPKSSMTHNVDVL
jgi:replicative DNA helicase